MDSLEIDKSITALAQTVGIDVSGQNVVGLQITGTWVGTLIVEGTVNKQDYFTLSDSLAASLAAITANKVYNINVTSITHLRVRCSAYTSGTIFIAMLAEDGAGGVGGGGGVYNDTPPTYIDGQSVVAQYDTRGSAKVTLATTLSNLADKITVYQATDSIMNGITALTTKRAIANIAASATATSLVALVASKKIRVIAVYCITGGTATNITFNSASAAISPLLASGINGGVILPLCPVGWFETVSGEALTVTTGAGSTTGVGVLYLEI